MNYRRISTKTVLLVVLSVFGWNGFLYAQSVPKQPILQIQQEFESGKLDLDSAALKQFRLLYKEEKLLSQKEIQKCATPAHMFLKKHEGELSPAALTEINSYLQEDEPKKRNQMREIYISESGLFEVHYEITGSDAVPLEDENGSGVPDYVEWVGEAADSSYRHEVINIGFTDPIPAGYRYEIYLENMGFYGETRSYAGTVLGPETYINVENDFVGFPQNTDPEGNQKGAIKATVAHELKHAIQYIHNKWLAPSGNPSWSEMDATLMEEVVYDDVNDYYNYIKTGLYSSVPNSFSVFAEPQKSAPGAYYFVTWMIYYSEAFGNELWRDVWELIDTDNSMGIDEALVMVLPEPGRDIAFETTFVQNHLWHFASGSRSGEDDYGFEEKEFYPNANVEHAFTGVPAEEVRMNSLEKMASHYFEVTPSADDNGLVEIAIDFDSTNVGLGLLLYTNSGETVEYIATGEDKAQVYIPTDIKWQDISRLGVVVANPDLNMRTDSLILNFGKKGSPVTIRDPDYADLPDRIAVYPNFPNPFNPVTTIRFDLPHSAFVELEVYDINGRKIQTLVSESRRLGTYEESFDGSALASGVYLYRLSVHGEVFIEKMTLIK
ncbi:MAG: MXAN_6640 family putative metalloprotease [Balneolaceae bacterium]